LATYLQLAAEQVWRDEINAPAHAALNNGLRAHYKLTASECGSKGDNNHLRGRHRSRNWDLTSIYCTNRAYATTDARDKAGDGNWLRATDIGISGPVHWEAAHRLDDAVRAGRLPCIAEWFGTFDGKTVVGWYQGHPSASDESHLYHMHVGLWTAYCNSAAQLELLYAVITGTEEDDMSAIAENQIKQVYDAMFHGGDDCGTIPPGKPTNSIVNKLDYLIARAQAGVTADVDEAAIAAEVAAALPSAAQIAEAVADEEQQRMVD
jgi:hypothetical protein